MNIVTTKIGKMAVVLILLGLSAPLILFLLSSGYNSKRGLLGNIIGDGGMELVLKEGEVKRYKTIQGGDVQGRIAIAYKYILASGIISILIGSAIVALFKPGEYRENQNHHHKGE